MKIKTNKLNKKSTLSQNDSNLNIISFGFFPNYFNPNNSCNDFKEYKISIVGNELNSSLLINNTNEKLLKKSQINKLNQQQHQSNIQPCNNIIATITVPKNKKQQQKSKKQFNFNKKSLTWVYYSYDCYGSKKTILDDNNSNFYPNNSDLKCSTCNSDNEKIFKLNNGMVECSKCLNINHFEEEI